MKNNTLLTQSLFLDGMICPRKMYLSANNEKTDNTSIISPEEIANYKASVLQLIHEYPRTYFPAMKPNSSGSFRKANEVKKIYNKLHKANVLIEFGEYTAIVDYMYRVGNTIRVSMVYPTTKLDEMNYYHAAYTYYGLTRKYPLCKIEKFQIIHVNKGYKHDGNLTKDFVKVVNATTSLKVLQDRITEKVNYFNKVLSWKNAPEKEIGDYCFKPDKCRFFCTDKCQSDLPLNSVFEVRSLRTIKKLGYYYKDIVTQKQLAESHSGSLSDIQLIQVTSALENKVSYQPELIKNWIDKTKQSQYLYFLDFECASFINPIEGLSPFSRVPYQFSLHILNLETQELKHFEYLADPQFNQDSRKEFIIELIGKFKDMHKKSKVVVFNLAYENSILSELKSHFVEFGNELNQIQQSLIDLYDIYKNGWYYDPRWRGILKLKQVISCIPNLTYDNLEIKNGASAGVEYYRLLKSKPRETKAIRNNLLKYCKQDTYSTVKLWQFFDTLVYPPAKPKITLIKIKSSKSKTQKP